MWRHSTDANEYLVTYKVEDTNVAQGLVTFTITLTDLAGNTFVRDSTTDGTTVTLGADSNAHHAFFV